MSFVDSIGLTQKVDPGVMTHDVSIMTS